MKKYILTLVALALGFSYVAAQRLYTDEVIEIPQGGVAKVPIKFETGGYDLKALQLTVALPDNITVGKNSSNKTYELATGNEDFQVTYNDNTWVVYAAQSYFAADTDGKGTFMFIYIAADASLGINSTYTVEVKDAFVSRVEDGVSTQFDVPNFSFTVKVVDYVLLDEASVAIPDEASNVKVKVKRTITAGQWSTICLPFDMYADQVEAVFGEGTEFAEFTSYLKDGGAPSTRPSTTANSISLNFTSCDWVADDGIFANTPYLVKSKNSITEFTLEDVELIPDEAPVAEVKNGSRKVGYFYGTSHAGITLPENSLFLNGGNFYYSKGKTVSKGFRGYFVLNDVLADMASSGVKMQINVDGTTVIEGIPVLDTAGAVYTIDGKKINNDVSRLPKGIYIIDGKKVAIK